MGETATPRLRVLTKGAANLPTLELPRGVATIGRSAENHLVLHDSLVSRQHAEIVFDGETVRLRDLGGKNPVRVNGKDVRDYELLDGDRISIGQTDIVFESDLTRHHTPLRVIRDAVDRDGDGGMEGGTTREPLASATMDGGPRGPTGFGGGLGTMSLGGISLDAATAVFDKPDLSADPAIEKSYNRLSSLYELSEAIFKVYDEEALYDLVLATATHQTQAERGFIGIAEEGRETDPHALEIVRFWDPIHGGRAQTLEMSETILSHIQRDRKAVLVRDVPERQDFGMSVIDLKIRSFICVPVLHDERFFGLVYVDTRGSMQQFSRSDLEFVSAIGRIAGLKLHNLRIQSQLLKENKRLRTLMEGSQKIIGNSPPMQQVFRLIEKVASRDTSVLIVGENGTGKELVARAIHQQSPRKDRPFVAVNCGAIPPNLVESELFGYEKGAFTGANQTTEGKFDLASDGTLFLDEVGEMPLDMQVKILRAIQERKFYRVGGKKEISVDIRVISATNRDLKKAIEEGLFREDLYFRLAVVTIEVPPLRERGDDLLEIAHQFLHQGVSKVQITKAAVESLLKYEWPGNIRELRNALEQALILGDGKKITPADLPPHIGKTGRGKMVFVTKPLSEVERQHVLRAIEEAGGNKAKAASLLGISRETLYQKLKQYQAE
jgi:DNA-binding NtrC family response regulator